MANKPIWIDRALFISPVYYGLCKNEKAFKKALKHLGIKKKDWPPFVNNNSDATTHYFEKENKVTAIICIGKTKGKTPSEICGLLIHEAVHIWQEVKEHIGEKNPGREFEAYAIQAIAQKLLEAYSNET